jgi:hypothetical protein
MRATVSARARPCAGSLDAAALAPTAIIATAQAPLERAAVLMGDGEAASTPPL